jgi:hypothetical protein
LRERPAGSSGGLLERGLTMANRQFNAEEVPRVVKAAEVEIHYTASDATIHAAGCQHHADEVHSWDIAGICADDWYYVAPCAKRATR